MKSSTERLETVLNTLIDELEEREDFSEVPVKDLLSSIMTAARLLNTIKEKEDEIDPLANAINSLKKNKG